MDAVVFDLELIKRFKKGQLSEIVEIGACKVDLTNHEITDSFQIYITPQSGYISKSTRKFINMNKEDIKHAVPFHVGIKKFVHWLGKQYYLCSWGKDDKAHLINQCSRLNINLHWLKNYNDIQNSIGKAIIKDNTNQMGLKSALHHAGISPIGKAHRGIDDAINTAQLLIKYHKQVKLHTNTISLNEISRYTQDRKSRRRHHPSKKENVNLKS